MKPITICTITLIGITTIAILATSNSSTSTPGYSYSSYKSSSSYSSATNYGSTNNYSSASSTSSTNTSTGSSSYIPEDIKASLYVLAEKAVKAYLKTPSTAKFSPMSECTFRKGESDTYMIAGYVDSDNSYGATLHEVFGCMALLEGEKLTALRVTIGDSDYFP